MNLAVRALLLLMLLCTCALAQTSPGFIPGKPLCAQYPSAACPAPANPFSLNGAFETKQDYVAGVSPISVALAPCTADPTGVLDSTAAINACETMRPTGSKMVWTGTFKISAPIVAQKPGSWDMQGATINSVLGPLYLESSNFTLNGGNSTFNYTSTNPAFNRAVRINPTGSITINGPGATGTYPTTGNIAVGATSFAARSMDTPILSAGDWIRVLYDDPGGYLQGEIKQVTSVSGGGTTINVNSPFAQVFSNGGIGKFGSITAGSLYVDSTYLNVPLTGGAGTGATANIVVSGGVVTAVALVNPGAGYAVSNALSASNANLGGAGSGFSIPVSGLLVPGWYKYTNVTENTEVNNINVNYTSSVQVIGLDTQPGAMNYTVRDNTFTVNSPLGLGFFGSDALNPQILNNVINGVGLRSSEISAIQGGRISGNAWWSPNGGSNGGLTINSGAFGTHIDNNQFTGISGSGVVNINDVSGTIFDYNTINCTTGAIGVLVFGGNNNSVNGNSISGCAEGVTVEQDGGTFVNAIWGAGNTFIIGNVVRNATNAFHITTGATFTQVTNNDIDTTVATAIVDSGTGTRYSGSDAAGWEFTGANVNFNNASLNLSTSQVIQWPSGSIVTANASNMQIANVGVGNLILESVGAGGCIYFFIPGPTSSGDINCSNVGRWTFAAATVGPGMIATAAAPTVAAAQIGYGSTTVAAGSGTCPTGTVGGQTVLGCVVVNIAGTARNIPFF